MPEYESTRAKESEEPKRAPRKKPVALVHIYRDAGGAIRYRGHDEDGDVVSEPKTRFVSRMSAAEVLRERYPSAHIQFSPPKLRE